MNTDLNGSESIQPASHRVANACLAVCQNLLAQIRKIKQAILAEFRLDSNEHVLRLALNEAEALALQTPYPHLFFPTLALEKAQSVRNWHAHQQSLRGRGEPRRAQQSQMFRSSMH